MNRLCLEVSPPRMKPVISVGNAAVGNRTVGQTVHHPLFRWFGLAVLSLIVSGILSGILVLGRVPAVARVVEAPFFFKRLLVCHVDLALLVWFCCCTAAMTCLYPGRQRPHESSISSDPAFLSALTGVGALILGAILPGGQPVMSNYIPVIDHPVFLAGLIFFGVGVAHHLARFLHGVVWTRGTEDRNDHAVRLALGAAAIAFLTAILTFALSFANTRPGGDLTFYYERLMWGGGHTLQVAYTAAMLGGWLHCVSGVTGVRVLSRRSGLILFTLLVAPHLISPLLAAQGTDSGAYLAGHTQLMRWAIFPVTLVVLGCCVYSLIRHHRNQKSAQPWHSDFRFLGFALSAALLVLGFVLGAMIRGSNTLVPAHYHATIGAVTVIFMTMTYPVAVSLVPRLARPETAKRAVRQLACFGFGQALFVGGFATGGFHDLPRKSFDGFISHMTPGLAFGLTAMVVGGLLALVGGVLYIVFLVRLGRAFAAPTLTTFFTKPATVLTDHD